MFKVAVSPAYFVNVAVDVVAEDGSRAKLKYKARFKRLDKEELRALAKGLTEGEITDEQIIERFMVGWDDVGDEEGKPLEFNIANRDKLMAIHPVQPTTVKAYLDSLTTDVRAKN
jgi:hypothetical protein